MCLSLVAFLVSEKEDVACPSREGQTGIVAAGEHESSKKLVDGVDVSNFNFCGGAPDVRLEVANLVLLKMGIDAESLTDFDDHNAGHYFCEGGYFRSSFDVETAVDDPRVVLSLDRFKLVPFGGASLGLSL